MILLCLALSYMLSPTAGLLLDDPTNSTGPCVDTGELPCETAQRYFNVCADIANAKLVCRHYCQLCDVAVKSGWSGWGAWGTCSISCGTGIQRRDRTCTNPPPQDVGDYCIGDNHEDRICQPTCPGTDGGWATWGAWTTCSNSCYGGKKSRLRTCTNPAPSGIGADCPGAATQVGNCPSHPDHPGCWR